MKQKHKRMKAAAIPIFLAIYMFGAAVPVKAGGLNGNEAAIISVLSGTFSYNGYQYKADGGYLAAVKEYLCQDDVDLTADECSQVLAEVQNNVEYAVESGYLVLMEAQVSQLPEDEKDQSEISSAENEEETVVQEPAKPETSDQKNMSSAASGDSASSGDENPSEDKALPKDKISGAEDSGVADTEKKDQNTADIKLENKEDADLAQKDQKDDSFMIKLPDKNTESVIKETGFSFKKTVQTGVLLGILFIAVTMTSTAVIFAGYHEKKIR